MDVDDESMTNPKTGDEAQNDDELPKTITDLPEFCLDTIFYHLTQDELSNVAYADPRLSNSASRIFALKFSNNMITYNGACKRLKWSDGHFLSTLRCFGPSMKRLTVEFTSANPEFNKSILEVILTKCRFTLIELRLGELPPDLCINATFPRVQEVFYFDTYENVHESWTEYDKWFPRLCIFSIKNARGIINNLSFTSRSTHLKHFGCSIQPRPQCIDELRKIADFLNSNAHIGSLRLDELGDHQSNEEFQTMVDWEALDVNKFCFNGRNILLNNSIRLKNLHSLKINGFSQKYFDETCLTTLEVLDISLYKLGVDCEQFIRQLINLKKIKIATTIAMTMVEMDRISNCLRNLTRIDLSYWKPESRIDTEIPGGLLKFIVRCRNLNTISLDIDVDYDSDTCDSYKKDISIFKTLRNIIRQSFVDVKWKMGYKLMVRDHQPPRRNSYVRIVFQK